MVEGVYNVPGGQVKFTVHGATAQVANPGASGTIDVNVANDRNWVDVFFEPPTTPSGIAIDIGSITDLTPEFTLGGSGLGSIALDSGQAPTLLPASMLPQGAPAGTVGFRYWLTGRFAPAGTVKITYIAGSWSFRLTGTQPAIAPVTLTTSRVHRRGSPGHDPERQHHRLRPRLGVGHRRGTEFADSDGVASNGIQIQSSRWTITLDESRSILQVGANQFLVPIFIVLDIDSVTGQRTVVGTGDVTVSPVLATPSATAPGTGVAYNGTTTGGTRGGAEVDKTAIRATNNRTFIDVAFAATAGHQLDPASIDGNEFALAGFGAGSGFQFSPDLKAVHLGGNVWRFMLIGSFVPGDVVVSFAANTWDENPARGPPGYNLAFTQSFSVVGSTADLVPRSPARTARRPARWRSAAAASASTASIRSATSR